MNDNRPKTDTTLRDRVMVALQKAVLENAKAAKEAHIPEDAEQFANAAFLLARASDYI